MPRQKKPQVKKRPDGRYRVRYKGKEFYSTISSDDAYAQRDEYIRQLQTGLIKRATVADYALPWIERTYPDIAKSTYNQRTIHLQHLVDAVGGKQLTEVTPSDIKAVYTAHYKGLSNSYILEAKQLFCNLFDSAVADGYCRSNPARDKTAKPHKGKKVQVRTLSPQQRVWVETLCRDHKAYPAVMTMLYAGLRPQEVKAFNVDRDVDFEKNIITVQETAHINGSQYEFTTEMKTEWSKRQIPLFPPLREVLLGKHGYIVLSARGKRISVESWHSLWKSYCFAMETAINGMRKLWYGRSVEHRKILEDKGKLPDWIEFYITPYMLRHACCAWLRDAGVELNTARRWMGNADTQMILRVYDSVSDDRSDSERKKLEKKLFGGQSGGQAENGQPETTEESTD
jgi:integrase